MKKFTYTVTGYSFSELDAKARENVKNWYLEDPVRNTIFYDNIVEELARCFPNSDLNVKYSLSYCQGDGVNIYGSIRLSDFLEKWGTSDKEKRTMKFYLSESCIENCSYEFTNTGRYGYSCKFMDIQHLPDTIDAFVETISSLSNIKKDVICNFFADMFNYFEKLDKEIEKTGYDYFYCVSDTDMSDIANGNDWYFDKYGKLITIC